MSTLYGLFISFFSSTLLSLYVTNFTYTLISLRKITSELSTIRRGTFMKSALKKSVVGTSISLILASVWLHLLLMRQMM